jgi:hypothetical protein
MTRRTDVVVLLEIGKVLHLVLAEGLGNLRVIDDV